MSEFAMSKSHFEISLDILKEMRKRFCTAWSIWRVNQRNFNSIMKRLCMFATQQMWFNFIDFLLNLIEDWMNQDINVTQQYVNALQRSDQIIWTFATHLSILKHQLSLYNNEHKWTYLFIKLRFELHVITTNVQLISIIWNENNFVKRTHFVIEMILRWRFAWLR